jgi:hypothetical protein
VKGSRTLSRLLRRLDGAENMRRKLENDLQAARKDETLAVSALSAFLGTLSNPEFQELTDYRGLGGVRSSAQEVYGSEIKRRRLLWGRKREKSS